MGALTRQYRGWIAACLRQLIVFAFEAFGGSPNPTKNRLLSPVLCFGNPCQGGPACTLLDRQDDLGTG